VASLLTRGLLTRGYPALARPAFGIVLVMVLMMAVAGVFGVRIFDSLEQLHDSASRASEEAAAAGDVLDALQDSETAVRGYLLTMRSAYLLPYLHNKERLEAALAQLDAEVGDSPWLRDEVGTLRTESEARLADIDRTLAADRAAGLDAALAVMLTDRGRQAMDRVRAGCARILQYANAERETHTATLIARERETLYLVVGAALAGTLLLGFAALGLLVSRARLVWAQAALSTQSGRLQATVDHIRDGVAVFDATDRLILWNQLFFPIAGLPATLAVPGIEFAGFAAAAAVWDPPLLAGPTLVEGSAETASGEVRVGEKVLEVWRSRMPDGGHILVVTDITRRTHAESIARQAQKMEALGQLTGGVAHDFNNLLQVIGGNLQLLSKDLAGNERAERRVSNALAGVARGSKLTAQLLAFGRRQALLPKIVDLGRFVRGLDDLLRRAIGDGIEVETVVSAGLWNVLVDPSQFENALLNLAINARDAMNGNGRMTIEAGNAALTDDYAARYAGVTPGQYVMLAVTDTGCGMSPEIMDQAFEPFFTTKPEGQGTGLGLSMVHGFVKQSQGHIKIYSEPGHGTTVRIYLPRVLLPEDVETEIETGLVTGGNETVLVVEDDEEVRATVAELLSELGYRVLRAKDAQSALSIVESGVPIDVLFTDVVMPGPLRSPELARRARARLPAIAVLFTSGYTDNAILHGGQLDPGIELLSKPYTREALARKLRHVLRDLPSETDDAGAAAVDATTTSPTEIARAGSTLLLVEDDELVRIATSELLAELGHTVLDAATGAEALHIIAETTPDILITDLGLPDMDGAALAAEARRRVPGLRVVFATGRNTAPELAGEEGTGASVLLRKPYNSQTLEAALMQALGQ
jgi:signal transduction histidine kinase/DNA-binding response OmpR family regulator